MQPKKAVNEFQNSETEEGAKHHSEPQGIG